MITRKTLILLAAGLILLPAAGFAQTPASKAAVDAGKARGEVGEQADGFLGIVTPPGDPALRAAVNDINGGRAAAYQAAAAKTGVSASAAGQATAQQLYARLPSGQYYKPLDGAWTRKP